MNTPNDQRRPADQAVARVRLLLVKVRDRLEGKAWAYALLVLIAVLPLGVAALLMQWSSQHAERVELMLRGGVFYPSARILSAGDRISVGDRLNPQSIAASLQDAGYSESPGEPVRRFRATETRVEILPGRGAYLAENPVAIEFSSGRVKRIRKIDDGDSLDSYELEPALVTNLYDRNRAKRRLVHYQNVPDYLRMAILAIEDHWFFEHSGIDMSRTAKAAFDGVLSWERPRGTSTLTQQLARGLFLTTEHTYSRKLREFLIARELEERLSKEQIFEYYCNYVWMGRNASFDVRGMGEAANVYFGKGLSELTLAESALLAGMIQRPSYLNPHRHPERAIQRRDAVLDAMLRYGDITPEEHRAATEAPLKLDDSSADEAEAPYFVDLVKAELADKFTDEELQTKGYRVYTTLDRNLQAAAVEAVRVGMKHVDEVVSKQRRFRDEAHPEPQAALVALDPRTGAIKALVGGRSYRQSQLNRALARRQPGSTFKPFVYAAALGTGIDARGRVDVLTASSIVDDSPTEFWWNGEVYMPTNFEDETEGLVTLREALRRSLNIATVKVAERTGYERIARLAKRVGAGEDARPTPSIALGAYEVTPLELATAYSSLANGGVRSEPFLIRSVKDSQGKDLLRNSPRSEPVLDRGVAFIVTNMLEDVVNRGTGDRVRALGFQEPAAGKTGTDDDGWFAGYTEKLVCVVWVGFDDNTNLDIEGARSALPIWAEFMKRAHALPGYQNSKPFDELEQIPDNVVAGEIDPNTGQLATSRCPVRTKELFVAGTMPKQRCELHQKGFFSRLFRIGAEKLPRNTSTHSRSSTQKLNR